MELWGYTIHKPLGAGGMATVFLGTQESFGRKVAIKVLDPDNSHDEEQASRFIREAKMVAGLAHPNIIPVYDVGQNNGNIYMSMEYLSGGDLNQWIKCGLLPEDALKIIGEIAQALQFSHDKGIIHRDIKPDNIMFRENNSAVLTDFGIARAQAENRHLTQQNTVLGTPRYMSPEQLTGERIDGRCDLYALGVVFYEMLMRRVPFDAEDYTALSMKHLNEAVPQLPKSLQRFQPLLEKMMAKKPQDRFQNGREVFKATEILRDQLKQPVLPKSIPSAAEDDITEKSAKISRAKKAKTEAPIALELEGAKSSGFQVEEQSSGIGPFKKYTLECEMITSDAHTFSIQFSAISTQILQWHDKRKGKASGLRFNVTVSPIAFDKVRQTIKTLCHTDGPYNFMSKLKVDVSLHNQFGKNVQEYRVE
jgi:serine/threonine protein kinase